MILIILSQFSLEDQGYWYLFVSLSVISVLIDMGFSIILTQEMGHLKAQYVPKPKLPAIFFDDARALLLHFVNYYRLLFLLFIVYNIVIAIFYLDRYQSEWVFYSFLLCIQFIITPFHHIYMGLDRVSDVQFSILMGNLFASAMLVIGLFAGWAFFALGFSILVNILVTNFFFLKKSFSFWSNLANAKSTSINVNRAKIKTLQKDYSLSWLSGLFVFNTIVPVSGKIYGVEVAGQIGLVFNLAAFMLAISIANSYNSIPFFNISIGKKEIKKAKIKFINTIKISTVIYIFCAVGCACFFSILANIPRLSDRVPDHLVIVTILVFTYFRLMNSVFANYYRAFKLEPFRNLNLLLSIVVSVILAISHFSSLTILFSLNLILGSYLSLSIVYYLKNFRKWTII